MNEEGEIIKICKDCKFRNKFPCNKYERKGGLFPTPAPLYLPTLTPEEEMMIARIDVNCKLYVKQRGMTAYVG